MAGLIEIADVRQALALTEFDSQAARRLMAPVPRGWQKRATPPRAAAVMILLYPARDARLTTVLTRRNPLLRGHSGQVSFPGGRFDCEDESLVATARRETCEEIGVCNQELEMLGQLPPLYIPASHFDVSAVVAGLEAGLEFRPNPAEVVEVFGFALDDLLRTRFKCSERRQIRGVDVHVPYYQVQGHKVWGATAILLGELEERLRRVLPQAILQQLA